MKCLFIFLLIPFIANCQTVHLEDERIAYKGGIKSDKASFEKLNQAIHAVLDHKGNKAVSFVQDTASGAIIASARMKLKSTQSVINNLHYTITVTQEKSGYKYTIDSVYLVSEERGVGTKKIPSEELVEGMETTGPVASQTEKILNEIDMKFQKVLDLLANYLKE